MKNEMKKCIFFCLKTPVYFNDLDFTQKSHTLPYQWLPDTRQAEILDTLTYSLTYNVLILYNSFILYIWRISLTRNSKKFSYCFYSSLFLQTIIVCNLDIYQIYSWAFNVISFLPFRFNLVRYHFHLLWRVC